MKTVAKDIEVICHFDSKGNINPLRFKYQEKDGDEYKVIKVDRVISKFEEKLCGNKALVFDCQSFVDGIEIRFQIKFFKLECRWLLFKI
jgi:hypothetical protein